MSDTTPPKKEWVKLNVHLAVEGQCDALRAEVETLTDTAKSQAEELERLGEEADKARVEMTRLRLVEGEVERLKDYLRTLRQWITAEPDTEAGRLFVQIDATIDAGEDSND